MSEIHTTARVQVTVEVEVGSWGADCSVSQVMKQAGTEASNLVRRALDGTRAKVVGEPVVATVITKPR